MRKRKMRRVRVVLIILACLFVGGIGIGCAQSVTSVILVNRLGDDDVFRINDSVCTLAEAKIYLTNLQDQYEDIYGSDMWQTKCGDMTIEDYLKKTVIAQMAQIKSMALFSKEYSIELTDEEKNTVNQAAEEYYGSLSEAEIEYMGVTKQDISNAYTDYLLASKVYSSLTTETNTEVSDDEARIITVQQIVINKYTLDASGNKVAFSDAEKQEAYNKAAGVLEKAQNGEDFTNLAENYSDNETTELSLSRGKLEETVEKVVFDLENDEISDIIETEDSYYIFRCINSYDIEATDANKEVIIEQRKAKAFDEVYEVFVEGLVSEFNEECWNSVALGDNGTEVNTVNFFDTYNQHFEN
ncbi:peptidylprolyl isomerase [Konateibacter massiliensis]|uniref:peptidylprolyl isomerase n=1 Tax=Konateibacter massiliensis TaxID=2002841 RepID=UPI000C1579AC|nr:peptidylprolyl isomerase [Konateibacter massiliensis]